MEIVGRQREQDEVGRFLDLLADGPAALVLDGEPGIGKTTVWRAAVADAHRRSLRVLACRASEAERALSFVGLGDLLEGFPPPALEQLPEPQRSALESALRRVSGSESIDRVALARGALALLRATAVDAPTVVAVDDTQWLDPATTDVLRFVAHRLSGERLGFVVSGRNGGTRSLELEHALETSRLVRLRLEPLSLEELEELIRLHLTVSFTRPTWRALHRSSGGNPFVALQVAETLERRERTSPGEELPVPATLAEALRERLAALPPSTRSALPFVAALAQPTLSLLDAAQIDGIEEAVRAGVLELDGERIRFAHPLLGSFVYAEMPPCERRTLHARLAALVADPEEHARHVARSSAEADESTAAMLETTAERAAARGDPEIASELAEHSLRLTPEERDEERSRRVQKAATYLFRAGDGARSRALLEELVGRLPCCLERARALRLLGWFSDDISHSVALLEQALAEAEGDLELRAQILSLLSMKESWRGRWAAAADQVREAIASAESAGAHAAGATARARLAWIEASPTRLAELERAVALEQSLPEKLPFADSPSFLHGVVLLTLDRIDEARQSLQESYDRAAALGDTFRVVHLGWLAELELRAGNWAAGRAHARAAEFLGRQWGDEAAEGWGAWSRALVEAHFGCVEAATEAGERSSRLARAIGFHLLFVRSETALGFLRLSAGDAAGALERLLPLLEERRGVSLHPCMPTRLLSIATDALVAADDLAGATALAARLEEHARALPVPSAEAAAARCRALLLAHAGDLDRARASIGAALAAHASLHEPFELGRTYLTLGSIERRGKRKAEARAALGRASAIFDELGSRQWCERARRELARTGLTRSFERELTPTELRVAELAADGARNKEIAGALFISVKTVEAHLSRAYAKLGVRSRVELASRLPTLRRSETSSKP